MDYRWGQSFSTCNWTEALQIQIIGGVHMACMQALPGVSTCAENECALIFKASAAQLMNLARMKVSS
jgi:hypothetical protein